jgi:hypothetical protein
VISEGKDLTSNGQSKTGGSCWQGETSGVCWATCQYNGGSCIYQLPLHYLHLYDPNPPATKGAQLTERRIWANHKQHSGWFWGWHQGGIQCTLSPNW